MRIETHVKYRVKFRRHMIRTSGAGFYRILHAEPEFTAFYFGNRPHAEKSGSVGSVPADIVTIAIVIPKGRQDDDHALHSVSRRVKVIIIYLSFDFQFTHLVRDGSLPGTGSN